MASLKQRVAFGSSLALLLGGCVGGGVAPQRPLTEHPTAIMVREHPTASRILSALRAADIVAMERDVSAAALLGTAPGYVYTVDGGYLHLHLYPSAAAAAAVRERIGSAGNTMMIDWVAAPNFYQCQDVIALYLGDSARVRAALQHECGWPFLTH